MQTFGLLAHPAHPPAAVRCVTTRVLSMDANWCVLRWKIEGAAGVVVPAFAGNGRADGLWRTTCFELFVAGQRGYAEFNFAPSERWAAYDFTGYREGMADRAMARAPVITPRRGGDVLFCDVAIASAQLPPLPWRYALTAVIEEAGGVKSFWAPVHGGERPDFHDPACLAGVLAAPIGA
ncbi:DOMON-like domain-containing protein [Novosphingobium sp.]|uniref:DOMON-like domain-containing protein n=1 Tax=Novosphingobium sp. TaxID=1874826 RepID=UPI003B52BCE7